MEEIGFSHRPKHKLNGITKADCKARKSDDLVKRDFKSVEPLTKCVMNMTEIKASDGNAMSLLSVTTLSPVISVWRWTPI